MSKNMTRKGLAFGAGLSMIAATVVGIPAQANTADQTLTMSPSAGTGFNTLNTSTFTITTVVSGTSEFGALRYRIINDDEKLINFNMKRSSTDGADTAINTGLADGAANRAGYSTATYTHSNSTMDFVDADTTSDAGDTTVSIVVADGIAPKIQTGQSVTISAITLNSADADAGGAGSAAGDANVNTDLLATGVTEQEAITALTGTFVLSSVSSAGGSTTLAFKLASKTWAGAGVSGSLADAVFAAYSLTLTSDNSNAETTRSADFVVEPASGNSATSGEPTTLELSVGEYTTDTTISVQAFIDSNGDNKLTAGEKFSAVQEMNFYKPANVTASVSFSPVLIGDTSVIANVTFSRGINVRQIVGSALVQVLFEGPTTAYANIGTQTAGWVSAAGSFRASQTVSAVAASAAFKATVKLRETPSGSYIDGQFATTSVGTALTADNTLVSRVVNATNALSTAAAVVDADADAVDVFGAAGAGTGKIRVDGIDAATAEIELFVGTDAAKPAGLASRAVAVTVTPGSGITATDKVVVGGEDITTALGATSFVVTTGSDGYVKFTVDPGAVDEGETITIAATSGGRNFANLVVTFTEGTYALYEVAGGARAITAKGSAVFNYQVADEFGIAPTDNKYSVVVTDLANENRTTSADFSYTAQIVAGKASVTVVDNGAGTGTLRVRAALHLNGAVVSPAVNVDSVINVVADATVAKLTAATPTYGTGQYDPAASPVVDNRTKLLLSAATFATFDSRFGTPGQKAPAATDATKVVVGATATNAAGTGISGVPVTFAAKGFLFKSGTRWSVDTITVMSGSTGLASVEAWSQAGGAQTIAISSGAATASQALTYEAGTTTASTFEITAAATSLPGKTVDVKVSVKDKFGNPAQSVTVALRSTGPGYLLQTSITTDKAGEAFTKLLVGASESGSAVITATMTIAGVETSKATTVVIGGEPVAKIGSFNGRVAVRVENAKGSTISVKIGRQWYKYTSLNDNYLWSIRSVKGRSVSVSVYVDAELQNVQTITVK